MLNSMYPLAARSSICHIAVLQLLFVCCGLSQTATSPAGEGPHRISYPAEDFSIELPAAWRETDPVTLLGMTYAMRWLVPNVPETKISHFWRPSGAPESAYPRVAVALTDAHFTDAEFRDLISAQSIAEELTKKWLDPAAGGILQKVQLGALSYDMDRHALWSNAQSAVAGIGDFRTMSAVYVTRVGTVQALCYSKASEYEKYEPVCRQILESVTIDARVAMRAVVPLSQLLGMSADQADASYKELVARVKGGDFLIDFRALRFACIKSSHCDARGKTEDLLALNQAAAGKDVNRVVQIAEGLIEQGFPNVVAHADLAKAYVDIGKPELAKFHLNVTNGLLRSVFDAGDGKTRETAFEAISKREEYAVLTALGLPYSRSAASSIRSVDDGVYRYTRWEVPDPKTGENAVVFFDVEAFSQTRSAPSRE